MRIIALMNQKGGVGKTTTTVNLGAALAEQGKKVCLIDLDPQAHLTINYGIDPRPEVTSLYDVLIDPDVTFLQAVHRVEQNIALVPSSIDLAAAEIELVSVLGREMLLKKRLESAQHDFDYILLDCPPSLGLLTINALAVAQEVIIPMQAHFLALQGMAKLLETIQIVSKRMNPSLKVTGVVLTMFDAQTKLSNEVVAELNGFIESAQGKPLPWATARIFKTKIRRNIKLAESPSFGQTIIKYDGASNGAADYRSLAREVILMTAGASTVSTPLAAPTVPAPNPASPSVARPAPRVEKVVKPQSTSTKPVPGTGKPHSAPISTPGAGPMTRPHAAPSVQVTVSPIDTSKLAAAKTAAPAAVPAAAPAAPPRSVAKPQTEHAA